MQGVRHRALPATSSGSSAAQEHSGVVGRRHPRASGPVALPRTENNSLCTLHQRHINCFGGGPGKSGGRYRDRQERPIIEAIVRQRRGRVRTRHGQLTWPAAWRGRCRGWKTPGERVHKGEILALIDSADVGKAKEELLQAIAQVRLKTATVERLKPLAADQAVPLPAIREAEAASRGEDRLHGKRRQSLMNLDLATRTEDFGDQSTDEIARSIRGLGLPGSAGGGSDSNSDDLEPVAAAFIARWRRR